MGLPKRATANTISALVTLGIFLLLLQAIGFQAHHHTATHVPAYHPASKMHLRGGHFAARRIKPQTLPKAKILHPLLSGGPHLKAQVPQSERFQITSPKLYGSETAETQAPPVASQAESVPRAEQDGNVNPPHSVQDTTPEGVWG